MKSLETIDLAKWDGLISKAIQEKSVKALENGKVLYFPTLPFVIFPEEYQFLSTEKIDPKSKNISYDLHHDRLGGSLRVGEEAQKLKNMIKRYALTTRNFVENLIPFYKSHLIQAKTSMRPVEIFGRKSSYRKDDTLLHVDAFPSNPTKGQRILRVFTNINFEGKSRVWRIGEPFEKVVEKMLPRVSSPIFGFAHLLKFLRITKSYRTPYDHYMLHMHNQMKGDADYQRNVTQEEIHFPPGSSWMVFTDQVSHAAMSGQHVLEQTFHLPVRGLNDESTAPLRVMEKFLQRSLL